MTDAFTPTPRRSMTPQRRARIYAQERGICWKCERRLSPGDLWSVEHVIALENGGPDDDANCRVTCDWCKLGKDREDHALAAKGRARATKHTVPGRHPKRGFRGWKGFDGRPIWANRRKGD